MKNTPLNKSIKHATSAVKELRQAGLDVVSQLRSSSVNLFADLVQEGEAVQNRAVSAVTAPVTRIRKELTQRVQAGARLRQARSAVSDNTDKLESVVQEQFGKVLDFVGLPSQAEVDRLNTRLASLRREVTRLKRAA